MDVEYVHYALAYVFSDVPEIFAIFTKMTVNKITNSKAITMMMVMIRQSIRVMRMIVAAPKRTSLQPNN